MKRSPSFFHRWVLIRYWGRRRSHLTYIKLSAARLKNYKHSLHEVSITQPLLKQSSEQKIFKGGEMKRYYYFVIASIRTKMNASRVGIFNLTDF